MQKQKHKIRKTNNLLTQKCNQIYCKQFEVSITHLFTSLTFLASFIAVKDIFPYSQPLGTLLEVIGLKLPNLPRANHKIFSVEKYCHVIVTLIYDVLYFYELWTYPVINS